MGATIQFRTGETAVRDNDRARMAKLGALLAGSRAMCACGSQASPMRVATIQSTRALSQERAEMVALELEKAGVPKERMIVEAMGERFASSEAQPDDQAFERCVEIRLESAHLAGQQLTVPWCRGGTVGITLDPPDSPSRHRPCGHESRSWISRHKIDSETRNAGRRPAARRRPAPANRHNYFSDATQQFLRRRLVEHARQVAHSIYGVGVLLPHSWPGGARKSAGQTLGIRLPATDSWYRRASTAPGKCSRIAPSFTRFSKPAPKVCTTSDLTA